LFVATLVLIPTSNTRLYLWYYRQNDKEKRTKTFCFDESKCKSIDEIDQDTPASSVLQFTEPGLKQLFFSKTVFQNISLLRGLWGAFA